MQIELAEELEEIPMVTEHGRRLRAVQAALYEQQQALLPIGEGRISAWRLREAEKKLVEARAWIEEHLREMSHADD